MEKITSTTSAANAAVSAIHSILIPTGKQVSLGKSTIPSMKTGTSVNNQLLPDLSKLVSCVNTQSSKFPKIAELMALNDSRIDFSGRE
ncbi:hypothetical protein [Enterococcus sp. BWR-S5]|uniref:hypothetical protein n=1 Tax=Enterococcus sp. BWR-S5 TaxID=2787714 RepID=UPI0019208570|nr:hypothetical protein [Enterococcus sp. BWR-S5]MBL1227497.1 hypothetical protein [Enterococcus sp. BWR-S5]